MAEKRFRAILCEGPDDLAAFRELLLAEGAVRKKASPPAAAPTYLVQRFEIDGIELSLQARNGKSGLAQLALDVAEGGAIGRPDMLLISFDPDLDAPAREFDFFETAFETETGPRGRAGPLRRNDARQRVFTMHRRDVILLPAPWRSAEGTSFANLPDEHSIERVLIDGILKSRPEPALVTWASDATESLLRLVDKHGYKRAFRLWNAALHPDAESFVPKLLQAHAQKGACLDAVRATPAAKALWTLLGRDG